MTRFAIVVLLVLAVSPCLGQIYANSDTTHPMALRSHPFGREFSASQIGTVNPNPKVPKPRIISKLEWGGSESSPTLKSHRPQYLTLHHGGTIHGPEKDTTKSLVALQRYGWNEKGWPDIPYHFVIDLQGNIYEARDATKVGDTNTSYDPTGHLLVCVLGNYEVQMPSARQLEAIADLYAWLADYYNVNPETLRSHLEYAATACPGKNLYAYASSGYIEGEIRNRIRKAYLGADAAIVAK